MNYELPCALVRDLLPGYVDSVTAEETNEAIAQHLDGCSACSEVYRNMKENGAELGEELVPKEDDKRLFQKIRHKLNRRTKITAICALVCILVIGAGGYALFNVPLKHVALTDVSVTAKVYPLEELMQKGASGDADAVTVYSDEADGSEVYKIVFPDHSNVGLTMSDEAVKKCGYVTSVTWSSPYFLREIRYADREANDTIYVSDFRTTVWNNRAKDYQSSMASLEMKEINQIIYVEKDGTETVLWKNPDKK